MGLSWGPPGASWDSLGRSWALVGTFWGLLAAKMGPRGQQKLSRSEKGSFQKWFSHRIVCIFWFLKLLKRVPRGTGAYKEPEPELARASQSQSQRDLARASQKQPEPARASQKYHLFAFDTAKRHVTSGMFGLHPESQLVYKHGWRCSFWSDRRE